MGTDHTMALLDRLRNPRRRALGIVTAVIAVLAAAGPSHAAAADEPPATVATPEGAGPLGFGLGSQPGPEASGRGRPVADGSGGFIYRNGRYTPLDTVDGLFTAHVALNNRGQTAGAYLRGENDIGGFVRSHHRRYTTFDVAPGPPTIPFDINDRGAVIGVAGDVATCVASPQSCTADVARSFLRRPNGDVTAVEVDGSQLVAAYGVNDRGAVVGSYDDGSGMGGAFLMEGGQVTTIVPPDAPVDSNIAVFDVNDRGQVVGCYSDASGTYHGFRYQDGSFSMIDPPGGADVPDYATTCAFGINNRGQVVGQYVDAAGVLHGYLWEPRRGFETIDPPPGTPVVGPTGDRGTVAADINDHGEILLPTPGGLLKGRAVPVGG
jgi:probable HAF family extracellular repeat protein